MRNRGCSISSRWIPVAIIGVLLFVGSMTPSPLRHQLKFGAFGPDKFPHLLGHAGYSLALATALADEGLSPRKAAILAVVVSTIYGVLTETLQRWIPGRAPERSDVVAGLVGSILGVLAWQCRVHHGYLPRVVTRINF